MLNRLSSLAFNGQTPAFGFGYDALSRRTSLTRPNGVTTSYTYDAASSLISVLHKLGTTTIDGASYTYDDAENRKTRTDKRLNTTLTFGYDNIYQLLSAKQGTTTKETYTYDTWGIGNLLGRVSLQLQYLERADVDSKPELHLRREWQHQNEIGRNSVHLGLREPADASRAPGHGRDSEF